MTDNQKNKTAEAADHGKNADQRSGQRSDESATKPKHMTPETAHQGEQHRQGQGEQHRQGQGEQSRQAQGEQSRQGQGEMDRSGRNDAQHRDGQQNSDKSSGDRSRST